MQAERMPAAAGWLWLRGGFALFRANPGFLNVLWFSSSMLLLTLSIVPFIGQAVASVLVPVLMVGVLNGCRAIDRGEPVSLALLFSGFQQHTPTLLKIGFVYLLLTALALAAGVLVSGEALGPLLQPPPGSTPDLSVMVTLMAVLQFATLASFPALVAAPLAAWFALPPGKALFFALAGVLRNWRAFVTLYLAIVGLSVGVAFGFAIVVRPLPAGAGQALRLLAIMAELFVLTPTAIAAFYLALRDIFQPTAHHHVAA